MQQAMTLISTLRTFPFTSIFRRRCAYRAYTALLSFNVLYSNPCSKSMFIAITLVEDRVDFHFFIVTFGKFLPPQHKIGTCTQLNTQKLKISGRTSLKTRQPSRIESLKKICLKNRICKNIQCYFGASQEGCFP